MRYKIYLLLIILASTTVGCGGGGSGATSSNSLTGYLIDSPVAGLTYSCIDSSGNIISSGTTGSTDGSFSYKSGNTCVFSIGNLTVGTTNPASDGVVTPYDLASAPRTLTNDANSLSIAQFLQTIDSGSNPNLITISPSVISNLSNISPTSLITSSGVALSSTNLQNLAQQATGNSSLSLVSSDTASSNLTNYLSTKNISTSTGTYSPSADSSGNVNSNSVTCSGICVSVTGNPGASTN